MNIIDDETYNSIVAHLKLFNYNITDEILEFIVESTVNNILIKTRRNKFPNALKYLVVDVAKESIDKFIADSNSEDSGSTGNNQSIQSMSEAGRSVSFGIDEYTKAKLDLLLQSKLKEHEQLIKEYRLLYKVGCPKDE